MRQVASAMPEVAPRTRIFLVILALGFRVEISPDGVVAAVLIGWSWLRWYR
jgi:hypothetical protein